MSIQKLLDQAFIYSRVQPTADPALLKQAIYGMRHTLREIEYQIKHKGPTIMFVITYESHGEEPKFLATAQTETAAKDYVEHLYGAGITEWEFVDGKKDAIEFCIGDASYIIRSTVHVK